MSHDFCFGKNRLNFEAKDRNARNPAGVGCGTSPMTLFLIELS
jgi:hypothetical protein